MRGTFRTSGSRLPLLLFVGGLAVLVSVIGIIVSTSPTIYVISGESMVPTFHDRQKIVVEPTKAPARSDVVVFSQQEQWPEFRKDREGQLVIKRIVGLSGDEIELKDRVLYVNGEKHYALPDDYECNIKKYSKKVPQGELFVLGDNTDDSRDSLRAICLGGDDPFVNMQDVKTWGTYKDAPFTISLPKL